MDDLTLRARVQRGIQFLDKERPGWELRIDTNILNIGTGSYCVLGQLEGNYLDARRSLFPFVLDETEFHILSSLRGFLPTSWEIENQALLDSEYQRLTEIWKAEILKRQQGKVLDIPPIPLSDVQIADLDLNEHSF